jgi:hypothetical protein
MSEKSGVTKSWSWPGKAVTRAHDAEAVRKVFGIELPRIRIPLVAARTRALDPEAVAVAVPRSGLVSGPVAPSVFLQQAVAGELIENLSAEIAVQIDRIGCRCPNPEGGAIGESRRAGRRLRRDVLLGKHGSHSLRHCAAHFDYRTTTGCVPAQQRDRRMQNFRRLVP